VLDRKSVRELVIEWRILFSHSGNHGSARPAPEFRAKRDEDRFSSNGVNFHAPIAQIPRVPG
jgi:hypothetical protein